MSNHQNEIINEHIMEGGKMKHTPTPWNIEVDKENENINILSWNDVDSPIVEMDNTINNLKITKFIVKAVNNHEKLLNMLQ